MKTNSLFDYVLAMIDRITMYKLLEYYLLALLGVAMLFGAIGRLAYSPVDIAGSTVLIFATCWLTNYIFAKVYNAPTNPESTILTALILALIITPQLSLSSVLFMIAAGGLAIASKYILAINHKHIFNPAAIAVVLTAFGPQQGASWWVGSTMLLPFVVMGGVIVAYKLRRIKMVSLFFVIAIMSSAFGALLVHGNVASIVQATIVHSSLFFLGFVMLTEPLTSPTVWSRQWVYAAVVGLCFAPQLHVGSVYTTPELALVLGNIVSFVMTPRVKTIVRLTKKLYWGSRTKDFIFTPNDPFNYAPGQYIELTFPHDHPDGRGSRRYFTLASSPTEKDVRLGIRFYPKGSSFKKALQAINDQDTLSIAQVGGEFTLPADTSQKLAFIAGGIGVTPFRSMTKYLVDTNQQRSAVLLYGERSMSDITYHDVFEEARQRIGMQTTYVVNDDVTAENVRSGTINLQVIQAEIPDYAERLFYISGPQAMVREMRKTLHTMGVARRNIKTDYFSGY